MLLKLSSTHLCPCAIDKLSNLEDLSTQMIQVVMVECDIAYHCLIKRKMSKTLSRSNPCLKKVQTRVKLVPPINTVIMSQHASASGSRLS